MKQLEKKFVGKGQVKGFIFTQIKKSDFAYIYEVRDGSNLRYEVFKHKINTRFECITYPSNKAFGIWAFTTPSFERALELFDGFNIQEDVNNG